MQQHAYTILLIYIKISTILRNKVIIITNFYIILYNILRTGLGTVPASGFGNLHLPVRH
ncbi:hypothetical protein Hdeb2414_s0004g00127751 [Helianthus debilis subsp. tardiflorus]